MKKLILLALAALTLAACGNKQETKNNENMKQEEDVLILFAIGAG